MTPQTRALFLAPLLGVLALSCTKKDGEKTDDSGPACAGPTANAGADISGTLGSLITLGPATGTVCTAGETPTYTWSIEAVPVDSAIDTTDLNVTDPTAPSFAPDKVGTYVLELVVSDAAGAVSSPDYVIVTIDSSNAPPIADCGSNQTAEANQRVDLDGSGSSDPEGAALTYAWTLASSPSCSSLTSDDVFNGATANASVVPDCEGVYTVSLAVSDGTNWSDPDLCSITVEAGNQAPIADAGTSTTLSPCTERNYELDGYGSYDPEGAELTYSWTMLSAPSGSSAELDDPTLPNPVLQWDVTGTYSFELRVSDGVLESTPDIVLLTFTDESANSRPVANAGEDQTITVTTECTTASYVFTCDDCPSEDVDLDGSASDDSVDGDELSFAWSDPSGELTIASQYSPVTEVLSPSFASTYDTEIVRNWEVTLTVSDCADDDSDTVNITYSCTGEYSP
jgi:hypothetical protein